MSSLIEDIKKAKNKKEELKKKNDIEKAKDKKNQLVGISQFDNHPKRGNLNYTLIGDCSTFQAREKLEGREAELRELEKKQDEEKKEWEEVTDEEYIDLTYLGASCILVTNILGLFLVGRNVNQMVSDRVTKKK